MGTWGRSEKPHLNTLKHIIYEKHILHSRTYTLEHGLILVACPIFRWPRSEGVEIQERVHVYGFVVNREAYEFVSSKWVHEHPLSLIQESVPNAVIYNLECAETHRHMWGSGGWRWMEKPLNIHRSFEIIGLLWSNGVSDSDNSNCLASGWT